MKGIWEYIIIFCIIIVVVILLWQTAPFKYQFSDILTPTSNPLPRWEPLEPTPFTPPIFIKTPKEITKGDKTGKKVIFTFDGGAGTQSVKAILDTLAKHDLKSSFFLTGQWAIKNSSLVEEIANDGHEIFNHTYTHSHLTQITSEEIIQELQKTEDVILKLTGKTTKPYFRPPYGDRDTRVLQVAATKGYQSIFWTVDALDWKEGIGAQEVLQRIFAGLKPGTIYLMHIGDTITGQILDEVLSAIKEQGFAIVPLTQGIES